MSVASNLNEAMSSWKDEAHDLLQQGQESNEEMLKLLSALLEKIELLESRQDDTDSRLDTTDELIDHANYRLNDTDSRLSATDARVAIASHRLDDTEEGLESITSEVDVLNSQAVIEDKFVIN